MRIFSLLIVLLGVLGGTLPARAEGTTTAAEIHQAASAYLDLFVSSQKRQGRMVAYEIGGLDPRLQLAECDDALSFEFVSEPEKSIRNTLLVSCAGDRPWRLFLNAEIEISSNTYVAATPLSRGIRITEAMLRQEKVVINQSRAGVYHDLEGLVGMETRRPVREGTLLSPSDLTAPEAVARGDFIKIVAKSGPVLIEARGTAITAGKIGDQITVENARSGREVRGVIIAPGQIRVVM